MTPPEARQLGVAAHDRGAPCVPFADPALLDGLGDLGTNKPLLKAWCAGWTAARLAEPVPTTQEA